MAIESPLLFILCHTDILFFLHDHPFILDAFFYKVYLLYRTPFGGKTNHIENKFEKKVLYVMVKYGIIKADEKFFMVLL
jgi:hypothetical protein